MTIVQGEGGSFIGVATVVQGEDGKFFGVSPSSRGRSSVPAGISLGALAALVGGVHVDLGLLQAGEDLLEERLVLGCILAQPLVHLLHLPAQSLQGLRGGGGRGWPGAGTSLPRAPRQWGGAARRKVVVLDGGVPGHGARGLDPRVAEPLLVAPALPQQIQMQIQLHIEERAGVGPM